MILPRTGKIARDVRRVHHILGVTIALLSLAAAPAATTVTTNRATAPASASPVELLAHGTDELYWIARVEQSEADPNARRTLVQMRSNATQHWHALGRIDGRAVQLASRGSDLAVLLDNGQWMLMWPGGGTLGAPLPNGARMLALAGDSSGTLWAVGRGDIAPIVDKLPAATKPATRGSTRGTPAFAPPKTVSGIALFQWDSHAWQPRAMIARSDDAIGSATRAISLAVVGSQPVIAIGNAESRVRLLRFSEETSRPELEQLGDIGIAQKAELLGSSQRAFLWMRATSGAGSIVPIDQSIQPAIALAAPAEYRADEPAALASATGQLRFIFLHDGKLFEQSYASNGQANGTPAIIANAAAPTLDAMMQWIAVAVLLMLSFFIFGPARRRTEPTRKDAKHSREDDPEISIGDLPPPPARPIKHLAPRLPRMQAAMLDALPVIVAVFITASRLMDAQLEERADVLHGLRLMLASAYAVYFLHTLIGELFTGRSIGKWLFGLRVATAEGLEPGALAIILRNIVRPFELALFFPIFIPLFSPQHQRIGDMVANTVVVLAD